MCQYCSFILIDLHIVLYINLYIVIITPFQYCEIKLKPYLGREITVKDNYYYEIKF